MHLPLSTYRIQFNKDFTFDAAKEIIDYLDTLGITTVYASPILQAAQGSMHGYDVTDTYEINREIGTVESLTEISALLKQRNMGWLQDIVPNHMAFDVTNSKLMDVLERGVLSPYYNFFDIDWKHSSSMLTGKVMVPFLGKELEECVDAGEINLAVSDSGFTINYFDTQYPLSIPAHKVLMEEGLPKDLQDVLDELIEKAGQLSELTAWRSFKNEVIGKLKVHRNNVDRVVKSINENREKLRRLLKTLHYSLTFWKTTTREINYRRFFTVNSLICLRMEDETVFSDYHTRLHQLRESGIIQGFRIDHIDGLYDPAKYIRRLRNLVGIDTYVIAEKILEEREQVQHHWEIEGTSGYEFLALVSQLFTDKAGARKILGFYKTLAPGLPTYKELVLQNKRLILQEHMAGEWDNLTAFFYALGLGASFPERKIKEAIGLLMLSIPVYRIYPESLPLQGEDLKIIQSAFNAARSLESDCADELNYLESLMTTTTDKKRCENALMFFKRLMQFTGPLTAKGVEDTTFYVYNPLISHDEVGDAPSRLGISVPEFHMKMINRQKNLPLSLNATATHDTKRGEDARLRLNVLSEIPDEWTEKVQEWMKMNQKFVTHLGDRAAPEVNEVYFIYQSLIGGFPEDFKANEDFIERIQAYLTKVMREAKVNSNWEKPDEIYEKACLDFVAGILRDEDEFLKSFIPFAMQVAKHARVYSLAQTLLKITSPGIPDTYQGTELWDLSFVDPDNRRPVDYTLRIALLNEMKANQQKGVDELLRFVSGKEYLGAAKLFVTWKALNFRKSSDHLFVKGDYVPLNVSHADNAIAFARNTGNQWALILIPLNLSRTSVSMNTEYVVLPEGAPFNWKNLFTEEIIQTEGRLLLKSAFGKFPVALLYNV
jgi:(1->4)-alpha-D-glucan 1-alpha-D-glucosylmutase